MFAQDHKITEIEAMLPLEMGYLPEYYQKKADAELNYTPKVREMCLQKLKEAITNDTTLKKIQFTDEALLMFLNSRKHNIERTFSQLHKYLKFRNSNIDSFTNIEFDVLSPLVSSKYFTILPWRCQDGCAICLIQPGKWDIEKQSGQHVRQMYITLMVQLLRDPMNQVNGIKVIYDLSISLPILKSCTIQLLHFIYRAAEQVIPIRVKAYHLLNMGFAGKTLWNISKMFLSTKMMQRVRIHESVDTLLDFFPRANIPVEYGGDLKDYNSLEWFRKILTPDELTALNIVSN